VYGNFRLARKTFQVQTLQLICTNLSDDEQEFLNIRKHFKVYLKELLRINYNPSKNKLQSPLDALYHELILKHVSLVCYDR